MRPIPVAVLLLAPFLHAQDAGRRAGTYEVPLLTRLGPPDAATAERLVTIEAIAEVRVVPDRLRVVFSVDAEGTTVAAASAACRERLAAARTALVDGGVAAVPASGKVEDAIDTDFIAALPVYAWGLGKQADHDAVVEKKTGYRAQYNIHVEVKDEATARQAIEIATARDGVELLAVDY